MQRPRPFTIPFLAGEAVRGGRGPEPGSSSANALGGAVEGTAQSVGDRQRLRALATDAAIAEERERRRIAGGLHDHVGQLLGIAKIKLGEALAAAPESEVAESVLQGREYLDQAIREIRALCFEISSPVLSELGLEAALEALAERTERRHGLPCRLELCSPPADLSDESAILLHSVVRELLWNAIRHSDAQQMVLTVNSCADCVSVVVEDDGVGFDAAAAFEGLSESGGLGLFAARERLEYLGGSLEIDSAPQRGARITLLLPRGR